MTARLRLLLAILVLALAPVLTPAAGWAAPPAAMAAAGDHGCAHPCDDMGQHGALQAACPCAGHLVLAPLSAVPAVKREAPTHVMPAPAEHSLASARWPPPLRPPRS